jgi:hypothetical protein
MWAKFRYLPHLSSNWESPLARCGIAFSAFSQDLWVSTSDPVESCDSERAENLFVISS